MKNKITETKLNELIKNVQNETTANFAKNIEATYGEKREIPLQTFIDEIVPKIASDVFVASQEYTELLLYDVLTELDAIKKED